jgi:homoserine dehydrogenase
MDSTGAGFEEALEEAQDLGYAEADPTADVEGFDAAAKAAILASLAFHTRVTAADVHREGITDVTAADIASAAQMGSVVKLLAIAELVDDGVSVRVHPAMIPRSHPLASVREAFNAVFVESDAAGQLMFYGPGAGGAPTASAVLGDLVTVARNRLSETRGAGESAYADRVVLAMGETRTRYHVAIDVDDRAGVLAEIATAFAQEDVSIQTLRQEGRGADAQLVVMSHDATDAQLSRTVERLRGLACVRQVSSVMRVEGVAD